MLVWMKNILQTDFWLQFRFDVNGEKKYGVVLPRYIHLDEFEGLTAGIDGNKHRLFYVDWWTNEEKIKAVEIPAY